MSDTIQVKVFNGDPSSVSHEGYMIVRGDNVVAFYVDVRQSPTNRLHPVSTCMQTVDYSDAHGTYDYPSITLEYGDDSDTLVDVAFPEFPGWRVHSCDGGKTLSICLVKHD